MYSNMHTLEVPKSRQTLNFDNEKVKPFAIFVSIFVSASWELLHRIQLP